MLLSHLLKHQPLQLSKVMERHLTGLALDSRVVQPGNVFFALSGTQTHGETYIDAAVQQGAIAILQEAPVNQIKMLTGNIPCISLTHLSQRVGEIAARFYDYPSHHLRVIGVTGTNGKTSVTHMIAQILQTDANCGLLGTLGYGTYGALQPGCHTTPDAIHLQTLLAQLRTQSVHNVVMEVSSHALSQGRVNGVQFEIAVLTNLSQDHLDYHQTMTAYGQAKQKLFEMPNLKTAVINYDDAFGQHILANLPPTVIPLTYSLQHKTADIYAQIRTCNPNGCHLDIHTVWGKGSLQSPLLGRFNVSNLLAALTVLLHLGWSLPQLLTQLTALQAVPGRLEPFRQNHYPLVIVDYAHTPAALEQTLMALREHYPIPSLPLDQRDLNSSNPPAEKNLVTHPVPLLWCIFGCGGDRDRSKRSLMGQVAQQYADQVILTDDNPRHESSKAIIEDIRLGCPTPAAIIPDRQQAIRYALQQAKPTDVVLIAGKGHEDYQQVGEQRRCFSDRQLVASLLNLSI